MFTDEDKAAFLRGLITAKVGNNFYTVGSLEEDRLNNRLLIRIRTGESGYYKEEVEVSFLELAMYAYAKATSSTEQLDTIKW